jgi:hypothetical protein
LSLISCRKEEKPLTNVGPFKLFAIDRPICQGMQVQLHLLDASSGEIIDFSQFSFDHLPNGLGEVSSSGLYKAPDFISDNTTLEIKVKWKPNKKVEASHALLLTANSDFNLISKIPHQVQFKDRLFSLSASNLFLFGARMTGEGPSKNMQFRVDVVDKNGQVKWSRGYGVIGYADFGMFYHDHILVSGSAQMGEHWEGISKIYSIEGNDLEKEIQDKLLFRNYFINPSGELYLSNSIHPFYASPTKVFKLSSEFDIIQSISINYPVHSFVVNQDGSVITYYFDEIKEECGVVMVDSQGQEKWKIPLPFKWYMHESKLVAINNQKFGLVKLDCKVIPCGYELIYYEFGVNGELINPGQMLVSSISYDMLENIPLDDHEDFYMMEGTEYIRGLGRSYISDALVWEDEVLVVFNAQTKNNQGLMIKGTKGSSLEYWWDPEITSQTPLTHIHLINKEGGLEWKTFCGNAICTFQLDKDLTFNSCF